MEQRDLRQQLVEKMVESMDAFMRRAGAVFREELGRQGATFPQLHLMKMVTLHGEPTVTELASIMMVAPPTASRMVDTLCARGMVERAKDDQDHRVTRVKLTGKGKNVIKGMEKLRTSLLTSAIEDASDQDLQVFLDILDRLTGNSPGEK